MSHEYLTGQVNEQKSKVETLKKKSKSSKISDDMKQQLKSFLSVS